MHSNQLRIAAFALVCAFSIGVVAAGNDSPAPAVKNPSPTATPRYAPGDEYFGRMKMSFLGINNTFKDQAIRAGVYTVDGSVIRAVSFADEALHDWAKKYPGDPQLGRSYYLATVVYRKIWTKFYQDKAFEYLNVIQKRYPKTFFGKQAKKDLAAGFTEHYFLEPAICPTPTPAPAPTPSMAPSRHPTPTPTPTETPTPTPAPTPTPTPAPGQPKQDVRIPPCVPPPTPTPTPTPTPSPVLTPLPSPSLPVPLHPASPLPSVSPPASPTPTATAR